ncbi:enoyl-CoA hydratase/isomerase family protein [Shewanella sp.]|nr:enoyl-CoA hydratase/isomerase family protein [Shewanella sp.]
MQTEHQSVLFHTLTTEMGKKIGLATLNLKQAHNALNLTMVQALTAQMSLWQRDPNIVAVLLDGAGEKAFCAGGDVRAIYHASIGRAGEVTDAATAFFTQEYQLDYLLHCFTKPVIVWGDGIVMGGGVGLMIAASHRIVTERSQIAMPEVSIGLYPDVGGSYFLNRMPGKSGLFLGMTAYNMSGADAHYVGIGNHYLNHHDKSALLDQLALLPWGDNTHSNHQALTAVLNIMGTACKVPLASSVLEQHQALLDLLMAGSLDDILANVSQLNGSVLEDNPWLAKALNTMKAASPISLHVVHLQSRLTDVLGHQPTLAQCFKLELALSVNCCAKADFIEGVRALLIDKDRNPQWRLTHDKIPAGYAQTLLQSPWNDDNHPLKDLQ